MEFENSRIVVATHYLVYGCAQALRDYLMSKKIYDLLFIAHPLNFDSKGDSYFEVISSSTVQKKEILFKRTSFGLLDYVKEIFWSFWAILKQKKKYHLFIAADNLNAFVGILLKKLGRVQTVAYWTLDYRPNRFENVVMNTIFHWMDRFCVFFADETWNVSPRMSEARELFKGMDRKKFNRQKLVPAGIWFDQIKRLPFDRINKKKLLFIGDLSRRSGVDHVLEAIPLILKSIDDFQFLVVGGGGQEEEFKKRVKELEISNHVRFTGWVRDRGKLEDLIRDSALGIALYDKYDERGNLAFGNFSDPGKLKDYMSSGMPVILSDVPYNARDIEKKECGKVINKSHFDRPDKTEIASAIIEILQDDDKLRRYRENAIAYIKTYDWAQIFQKSLSAI